MLMISKLKGEEGCLLRPIIAAVLLVHAVFLLALSIQFKLTEHPMVPPRRVIVKTISLQPAPPAAAPVIQAPAAPSKPTPASAPAAKKEPSKAVQKTVQKMLLKLYPRRKKKKKQRPLKLA